MAVESDYNALVFSLNDIAEEIGALKLEVEKRQLEEKRDGLKPNETHWVHLMLEHTTLLDGPIQSLSTMAETVLLSRRGEPVFEEQPQPPPARAGRSNTRRPTASAPSARRSR